MGALLFADFMQMSDATYKEQQEQADRDRQNAAYTAWLMGAGETKTWKAFCEHFGLIEVEKRQKENDKLKALEILEAHQAIKAGEKWRGQSSV